MNTSQIRLFLSDFSKLTSSSCVKRLNFIELFSRVVTMKIGSVEPLYFLELWNFISILNWRKISEYKSSLVYLLFCDLGAWYFKRFICCEIHNSDLKSNELIKSNCSTYNLGFCQFRNFLEDLGFLLSGQIHFVNKFKICSNFQS